MMGADIEAAQHSSSCSSSSSSSPCLQQAEMSSDTSKNDPASAGDIDDQASEVSGEVSSVVSSAASSMVSSVVSSVVSSAVSNEEQNTEKVEEKRTATPGTKMSKPRKLCKSAMQQIRKLWSKPLQLQKSLTVESVSSANAHDAAELSESQNANASTTAPMQVSSETYEARVSSAITQNSRVEIRDKNQSNASTVTDEYEIQMELQRTSEKVVYEEVDNQDTTAAPLSETTTQNWDSRKTISELLPSATEPVAAPFDKIPEAESENYPSNDEQLYPDDSDSLHTHYHEDETLLQNIYSRIYIKAYCEGQELCTNKTNILSDLQSSFIFYRTNPCKEPIKLQMYATLADGGRKVLVGETSIRLQHGDSFDRMRTRQVIRERPQLMRRTNNGASFFFDSEVINTQHLSGA